MSVTASVRPAAAGVLARPLVPVRVVPWVAVVGLFAVAFLVRLWAAGMVVFPANEGSAYYAGVARNLIEGRGLVTDAMWSYATPPLVLPKPAFELWLPMASFLAAIPMAFLGTTYAAAQLSSVALGAAVAPLAWLVARDAAVHHGLEGRRIVGVAVGSGLTAAVLGPFLVAAAAPDSTTPFLVFGLAACVLMPRAVAMPASRARLVAGLALGALLGLAYLARQEALYLGLTYVVLAFGAARAQPKARRLGSLVTSVAPVVVAGLFVVAPWLLRNLAAFGTLFPGQALENVYLTANEGIFAYLERPTLRSFLAQGPLGIVGHQVEGLWHGLFEVITMQAMPVGLLGVPVLLLLRRSPALRGTTMLRAVIASGLVVYLATGLLVPVATRWGTFLHASGPLLVGLIVVAVLGLDGAVARLSRLRRWERPNPWLAPIAMVTLAAAFGLLQVTILGAQSRVVEARMATARDALQAMPAIGTAPTAGQPARSAVIISDHPIWLAETLRRPVIALPDEPVETVVRLARDFGTSLVLVFDERGRYPAALTDPGGAACFSRHPIPDPGAATNADLFVLDPACEPS